MVSDSCRNDQPLMHCPAGARSGICVTPVEIAGQARND